MVENCHEFLDIGAALYLSLISGLHFTEVTHDRVFLVYALMTGLPINIGAGLKSKMCKAKSTDGEGMLLVD